MSIYFYSNKGKYGCFSNFSHNGFFLDGKYWKTSEHYFQSQKFISEEIQNKIQNAANPMEAAQLGRNRKYPLRKDWEAVKDTVMYKAVYAKFSQNNDIKLTLLTTKDEELIENTSSDYYWGCGSDGTGKNILGKILMKVRSEMEREFLNNGDELDEL